MKILQNCRILATKSNRKIFPIRLMLIGDQKMRLKKYELPTMEAGKDIAAALPYLQRAALRQ